MDGRLFGGKMNDFFRWIFKAGRLKHSESLEVERNLETIPEAFRTPEICLRYLRKNGRNLAFVPEALKTAELCAIAVRSNTEAFADKYRKINFPRILEELSYPVLHISLSEDNNELQVSLSYVLAKYSILRAELLNVKMDEKLNVLGFEHAVTLLC